MFKKFLILVAILTSFFFGCRAFSMADARKPNQYLYGVTIDSILDLPSILNSLENLKDMTVRIVFDEYMPPEYYKTAVNLIHQKSKIMGELLDSASVKEYTVEEYKERADQYIVELKNVDIWEVGNEVNGEWLGPENDVVAKITTAYSIAKSHNKVTALTLFYNEHEDVPTHNKMFTWANTNIPEDMKKGLDYVLVSYYPNDLNSEPDWPKVFNRLHALFPNAHLGFGEVGTSDESKKSEFIQYFYNLKINEPYYIGGYFWWYYIQDMIPHTRFLHSELYSAIEKARSSVALA